MVYSLFYTLKTSRDGVLNSWTNHYPVPFIVVQNIDVRPVFCDIYIKLSFCSISWNFNHLKSDKVSSKHPSQIGMSQITPMHYQ